MKIVALVCRLLLGVAFLVFGLNGFLNFMQGKLPPGDAGAFLSAMMTSHYMLAVCAVQIAASVLLLVNRYVPLGLVLLAPVLFNIIIFHLFMFPQAIAPGLVCVVCWLIVALQHRTAFAGILRK